MTKLVIHLLNNCVTCKMRHGYHESLANMLSQNGVPDVQAVTFGKIDGETYAPLDETYDQICRSETDPHSYVAPVYVLETNGNYIKLQDMAGYSVEDYANYVLDVLDQYGDEDGKYLNLSQK